ncbi:MAG: hypothetical protein ACP5GW_06390, partial [Caldisericaceae bacterium]
MGFDKIAALMLAVFVLTSSAKLASAQIGAAYICDSMFNVDQQISSLSSSYSAILSVSLVIVLMVLSILSIIYAIGRGFGISKLVSFVQREYLESIFNLALIGLVMGGLGFADAAIGFFASISSLYASSSSYISSYPSIPNTASGLLLQLCNNYVNKGVYDGIEDYLYLLPSIALTNFLGTMELTFNMPLEVNVTLHRIIPTPFGISTGFEYEPFKGIYPYSQILNTEIAAIVSIVM